MLTSLFLTHYIHSPTSETLYLLIPLPGMFFPNISEQFSPSLPSDLCWNVNSSVKAFLIITANYKEYMRSSVYCSVIYNCQDVGADQVPISRWVDKKAVVHLHNGILLGNKIEIFTFCNTMDGPGEQYAKWNKSVRKRQILYNFTEIGNLRNKIN